MCKYIYTCTAQGRNAVCSMRGVWAWTEGGRERGWTGELLCQFRILHPLQSGPVAKPEGMGVDMSFFFPPSSFCQLGPHWITFAQVLVLKNNALKTIPPEVLRGCSQLANLDFRGNPLTLEKFREVSLLLFGGPNFTLIRPSCQHLILVVKGWPKTLHAFCTPQLRFMLWILNPAFSWMYTLRG